MSGPTAPAKIVIPVYPEFDLLDVCGPAEIFHWAGFEVVIVTQTPGAVLALNTFSMNVATDLSVPIPCDAMWVPGASPATLQTLMYGPDQTLMKFLVAQADVSAMVCSVCEGALLLAKAGLLDGFTATTHWYFMSYLQAWFPKVTLADGYPRYVVDRNRLTGGGISSGLDEALKLVALMGGEALARQVQQTTQYYPDPPVSSDIPHPTNSPMPAPPVQ